MKSIAALVVGNDEQRTLEQALDRMGLIPLVRKTIWEALDKLRRESFAAIFIERDSGTVDPLEFILNARDFDARTPIFVVGRFGRDQVDRALLQQQGIRLLDRAADLGEALAGVLGVQEVGEDG